MHQELDRRHMNQVKPTLDSESPFGSENDYAAMFNMIYGHSLSQMVRCAAMFSFADHLAEGPCFAEKVAEAEGLDPNAAFRLMRACTGFGLMTYDKHSGFSATPLLKTLRKNDPRSLRGLAMVLAGHGHWAPWGKLDAAVRNGQSQASAALGKSLWEYYATPAGAEEAAYFTKAVESITGAVAREASQLIDTKSVEFAVDVGGASGSLIHALMGKNKVMRGAILDLPHVKAAATKAAEILGFQDRLSVLGGDFLVSVPSADLYLVSRILCDWPDDICLSILRNCRRAIKPGGRLVLIEMLVDEVDPPPFVSQTDLTMMVVLGAKERTLDEFKNLLQMANFDFTGMTRTATPFSLIEAISV
jgi:hypothetical protein